jgi:hypothetical protein
MCKLHREVIDTKVAACNQRVDGVLEAVQEVRSLQKTIMITLLVIAIGVGCTLFGVIMGRGIDFGWLIP